MSWWRPVLITAPVVVAMGVAACSYTEDPDPYRPPAYYERDDAEAAALGDFLYRRDCAFCHGNRGQGTGQGPDLVTGVNGPALTDFMLRTGRMPVDDPDAPLRPGEPVYDDDEIAAVVAYLETTFEQPGPDIPDVDPAAGDLAGGQALYQEHCAACHATTGIGGAMLASDPGGDVDGVHIPDLHGSSPVEVGEAVRTGPGAMPRFGPGLVDPGELDDLGRYVDYLQDPADEGGAPLGRVGPVVEGAVGWVVGLGLLLLFTRWIGTRRKERA